LLSGKGCASWWGLSVIDFCAGTVGNASPFSSLWIFSSQLNCFGSNPSSSRGSAWPGRFSKKTSFNLGVPPDADPCGDITIAERNIKDDLFYGSVGCICRPEAFQLLRENISWEIPELLFWILPDAERLYLILLSVSDLEVNHLKKRGMAAVLAPAADAGCNDIFFV
jgi:hypothetical protein